jgi:hypothetical protein
MSTPIVPEGLLPGGLGIAYNLTEEACIGIFIYKNGDSRDKT